MAEPLSLATLSITPVAAVEHASEVQDDGLPPKLPNDFIWSLTGTKHVDYPANQHFEGETATVGRSGHLGSGGFGSVDVVVCKRRILARKQMHSTRVDAETRREARILEGIIHRHVIQLVGSYTQRNRFYLLLHPVAECNLKEFMQTPENERDLPWDHNLKSAFGCLAGAVAFLHSTKIAVKHKDIKPTNVLMFCGTPMLTDFGLSNSFKGAEDSKSSGITGKTPKYAAPEVVAMLPRGTSQDVFSLGLVFQDMYWALHGHTDGQATDLDGNAREESNFGGQHLTEEERVFCRSLPLLAFQWDSEIRDRAFLTRLMRLMTAERSEDRPTATTIWQSLQIPSTHGIMCGRCCHDDLPRLDLETTDRLGQSNGSSTIVSSLRSRRPEKSMLSCSSLPPFDSTHTAYYSVPSGDPQLSDYEKLLDDQGYLPRLEDQYDWSGRAMHVVYNDGDHVPLVAQYTLGVSPKALVEAVQCRGRLLARKSMRISRRIALDDMISEVGLIQRLRHRHIVQVIGSYIQRKTLSILTYPVADCTLEAMMDDIESNEMVPGQGDGQSVRNHRLALKKFFACLAQAIEYIHDELVKHMDIKPQNILVRRLSGTGGFAHVYITDFGVSRLYTSEDEAMTDGPTSFTRRFAAPELVSSKARGFPADIFSLGCVFLEMQTTVLGCSYHGLKAVIKDHRTISSYSANPDDIDEWIKKLEKHPRSVDGLQISPRETRSRLATVRAMLNTNPSLRPTAVDIALKFGSNECCNLDREDFRDEPGSSRQNVEG
ncbi:kinase-like protein [Phaeosphaeriaceae sp. SRC1lsM3a]|nr:kinase-like protein [Stagonospora sp. SRC1lsM3a]